MRTLISYPIRPGDPVWPGNPDWEVLPAGLIGRGESANTFNIRCFNHCGTHMDAPWHYNDQGKKLAELPFDGFFYARPLLLDVPKGPREKITQGDLWPHRDRIAGCDLLMIRTGFGALRATQPDTYARQGPGFGSDAARFLMDHCPGVRALALDTISLASFTDTVDGDEAHRTLLGVYHPRYICIIEDARMASLPQAIHCAAAIPLMIEGIDGGPVTMWVEHA